MACSTGCVTQDHTSYARCMKDKGLRIAYANSGGGGGDFTAQKKWDRDLDAYEAARRQGIQPAHTGREATDAAVQISDKTGKAFEAA